MKRRRLSDDYPTNAKRRRLSDDCASSAANRRGVKRRQADDDDDEEWKGVKRRRVSDDDNDDDDNDEDSESASDSDDDGDDKSGESSDGYDDDDDDDDEYDQSLPQLDPRSPMSLVEPSNVGAGVFTGVALEQLPLFSLFKNFSLKVCNESLSNNNGLYPIYSIAYVTTWYQREARKSVLEA